MDVPHLKWAEHQWVELSRWVINSPPHKVCNFQHWSRLICLWQTSNGQSRHCPWMWRPKVNKRCIRPQSYQPWSSDVAFSIQINKSVMDDSQHSCKPSWWGQRWSSDPSQWSRKLPCGSQWCPIQTQLAVGEGLREGRLPEQAGKRHQF